MKNEKKNYTRIFELIPFSQLSFCWIRGVKWQETTWVNGNIIDKTKQKNILKKKIYWYIKNNINNNKQVKQDIKDIERPTILER